MDEFKKNEKNPYFEKMRSEYKKGPTDKDISKPKTMDMYKHVLDVLPSRWTQKNVVDVDRKSKLPLKTEEND